MIRPPPTFPQVGPTGHLPTPPLQESPGYEPTSPPLGRSPQSLTSSRTSRPRSLKNLGDPDRAVHPCGAATWTPARLWPPRLRPCPRRWRRRAPSPRRHPLAPPEITGIRRRPGRGRATVPNPVTGSVSSLLLALQEGRTTEADAVSHLGISRTAVTTHAPHLLGEVTESQTLTMSATVCRPAPWPDHRPRAGKVPRRGLIGQRRNELRRRRRRRAVRFSCAGSWANEGSCACAGS